jgi:hypothetical protein
LTKRKTHAILWGIKRKIAASLYSKRGANERIHKMRKVTKSAVYDTETATFVSKVSVGNYGDPCGYEECLFVTPEGKYFLYVNGGADSKYPTEEIKASCATVAAWKRANL